MTCTSQLACRLWLACTFALWLTCPFSIYAQIDRGTIQGVVRDESGAVIPGAKIQIVRIDTNSTLDLATNEEGLYTAPNLTAGNYRVVVEQAGFTSFRREPIEIRPGVQIRVDVYAADRRPDRDGQRHRPSPATRHRHDE